MLQANLKVSPEETRTRKFEGIYSDREYKSKLSSSASYDFDFNSTDHIAFFIKYNNKPAKLNFKGTTFGEGTSITVSINGTPTSINITKNPDDSEYIQEVDIPYNLDNTTVSLSNLQIHSGTDLGVELYEELEEIKINNSTVHLPHTFTVLPGKKYYIDIILSTTTTPQPQATTTMRAMMGIYSNEDTNVTLTDRGNGFAKTKEIKANTPSNLALVLGEQVIKEIN